MDGWMNVINRWRKSPFNCFRHFRWLDECKLDEEKWSLIAFAISETVVQFNPFSFCIQRWTENRRLGYQILRHVFCNLRSISRRVKIGPSIFLLGPRSLGEDLFQNLTPIQRWKRPIIDSVVPKIPLISPLDFRRLCYRRRTIPASKPVRARIWFQSNGGKRPILS